METNVVLRNDGQVMWDQPAITKSSCSVDVAFFPFDLQQCHLTFGSWTHNGNQMDLSNALDSADLADFVPNVEWEEEGAAGGHEGKWEESKSSGRGGGREHVEEKKGVGGDGGVRREIFVRTQCVCQHQGLRSNVEYIANSYQDQRAAQLRIGEWRKVAKVMDRFFIVFTNYMNTPLIPNPWSQYSEVQLEGLIVSEESTYPVFLFFFFSYLFIMIANVGIAVLIFIDKNLHQPMYLLFCNLPLNDVLGNSILIPRLMLDLLRPPSERLISYHECVVQAFTTHVFGTTSHTVLMIMAFDRYVAICDPLRYAAIMTNKMVMKLTVSAWGVALVMVGVLLGLTIRLNRCRSQITNSYCDNASLFKLSCEDVSINNIYGLVFTVVLFSGSIGSTVLTYTKIAVVCGTSKNKTLNSKALKTCSTHLTVYLLMLVSGLANIVLARFPQYTPYRKLSVILFHII
ncbi:hypothetical protein FQN60_018631, partial [Etheostoma spectabile]